MVPEPANTIDEDTLSCFYLAGLYVSRWFAIRDLGHALKHTFSHP